MRRRPWHFCLGLLLVSEPTSPWTPQGRQRGDPRFPWQVKGDAGGAGGRELPDDEGRVGALAPGPAEKQKFTVPLARWEVPCTLP